MPWHVVCNPRNDYVNRIMEVDEYALPMENTRADRLRFINISEKKIRSLVKGKAQKENLQVLQLFQLNEMNLEKSQFVPQKNPRLKKLLSQYRSVFRDELPDSLPPLKTVCHENKARSNVNPTHRPLLQLSPVELKVAKKYLEDLLRKKKIRISRSPYEASFFLVKKGDELRGSVYCRALNRIFKPNNAPSIRLDKMFDRQGEAKYFSKLDLRTGFHQIWVNPRDIEKTTFNIK